MVPPADTNPPFAFGISFFAKSPEIWDFFIPQCTEYKWWIKNGKNAVDKVPDSGVKYTQTNAENKPPFAFGTIWGIKCKN